MNVIDLNNTPRNHQLSLSVEKEETTGERNVRLVKDMIIFLVAIVFVCLLVSYCFITMIDANASADAKRWAMSVLSAVGGGMVGYLVKK